MFIVLLLVPLLLVTTSTGVNILVTKGTAALEYNPPLNNTVQSTTISLSYEFTTALDTTNQGLLEGFYSPKYQIKKSCTSQDPFSAETFVFRVNWTSTTGPKYSTIKYTAPVVTNANGESVLTQYGKVIDGALKGYNVVLTITFVTLDVTACLQNGIKSENGILVILFTKLDQICLNLNTILAL